MDVRALAASSARCGEEVRAGLSRVGEREAAPDEPHRLPAVGRGAIGCEPMGCPLASRHCAWW